MKEVGELTWSFGDLFFFETPEQNYVWSDPDYNGSDKLWKTNLTYTKWCKQVGIPFGRDKGRRATDIGGEAGKLDRQICDLHYQIKNFVAGMEKFSNTGDVRAASSIARLALRGHLQLLPDSGETFTWARKRLSDA